MAALTKVISTSTIRPATGDDHPDFNSRIELTNSDVQFLLWFYSQRLLVFHKNKESPVEQLKATLSQALDRLYPLAGRLVAAGIETETPSFSIGCNGAGVTFVHAQAVDTVAVKDILDPDVFNDELLTELAPMNGVMNHETDLPLLAVQVTDLADGFVLAVSMNHCAADGKTFWDFLNVWSEFARGDELAISNRENFQFARQSLDFPVRVPFRPPPKLDAATLKLLFPRLPLKRKILRFSRETIAELKVEANAGSKPGERQISSLQALMAHLWVCITRSRGLTGGEEVSYVMPVGLRARLEPPLPQSYLGTAVRTVTVTATASELLGRGIGWAARQINNVIAAQTPEEARKFFYDSALPPLGSAGFPTNLLISAESPRFDVYGNDFGWGKPLGVRTAPPGDGALFVFEGADEGSVDFEATLLTETFRALEADPEFARYSPY